MALTLSEASALLLRAFAAGRVAHAYLIHGTADARLLTAVEALAGRLVALDQYPAAGGDVWRHPDVYRVEPQGRSRGIAVDQVRELEGRLQLHAAGVAGKKVAVMVDAERMNDKAANAFLKTLEEPPPNSHIFLVSEFPDQLPETVLSRCVEVGVRAEGRRGLTEHERMLLAELDAYAASGESGVLSALALGRRFQAVLAALKEEVVAKVKAMGRCVASEPRISEAGIGWVSNSHRCFWSEPCCQRIDLRC
jgi:DNA polymerase-3 subunit delta'